MRLLPNTAGSLSPRNRGLSKRNKTGFKGVIMCRQTGKWSATIVVDRKQIWLGRHESPEAAARAYDEAARKYHGEFAWLNFG